MRRGFDVPEADSQGWVTSGPRTSLDAGRLPKKLAGGYVAPFGGLRFGVPCSWHLQIALRLPLAAGGRYAAAGVCAGGPGLRDLVVCGMGDRGSRRLGAASRGVARCYCSAMPVTLKRFNLFWIGVC